MGYGINLKAISLPAYRDMLKTKELLPGRRLLLVGLDDAFDKLQAAGFDDAEALLKGIGAPKKLETVSQQTGIAPEYLILLKREMGGLQTKSVSLGDFPHLPPEVAAQLREKGLKDSEDVYDATQGFAEPERLCELAGISETHARAVCALCNLIRINGVGKVFAHILVDAGYRSARDIADEDAVHLRDNANWISANPKYNLEPLGEKDAQYCIDYAVLLLKE